MQCNAWPFKGMHGHLARPLAASLEWHRHTYRRELVYSRCERIDGSLFGLQLLTKLALADREQSPDPVNSV